MGPALRMYTEGLASKGMRGTPPVESRPGTRAEDRREGTEDQRLGSASPGSGRPECSRHLHM